MKNIRKLVPDQHGRKQGWINKQNRLKIAAIVLRSPVKEGCCNVESQPPNEANLPGWRGLEMSFAHDDSGLAQARNEGNGVAICPPVDLTDRPPCVLNALVPEESHATVFSDDDQAPPLPLVA